MSKGWLIPSSDFAIQNSKLPYGVGDVIEEDENEDDVLVFGREPELGLEAEVGGAGFCRGGCFGACGHVAVFRVAGCQPGTTPARSSDWKFMACSLSETGTKGNPAIALLASLRGIDDAELEVFDR